MEPITCPVCGEVANPVGFPPDARLGLAPHWACANDHITHDGHPSPTDRRLGQ